MSPQHEADQIRGSEALESAAAALRSAANQASHVSPRSWLSAVGYVPRDSPQTPLLLLLGPDTGVCLADWFLEEVREARYREKQADDLNEFKHPDTPEFPAYYDRTTEIAIQQARLVLRRASDLLF